MIRLLATLLLVSTATERPEGDMGAVPKPAPQDEPKKQEQFEGPILLTLVNGEIEPKKPTGETWDVAPEKGSKDGLGGLTQLVALIPGAGSLVVAGKFLSAAAAMDTKSSDTSGTSPDPFIRLS